MTTERLYQFPSKPTPVPADIIYCGDSADAFDEVNITISALIGAYPNLLGIGELTLAANTFPYSNNSAVITAASISPLAITLVADSTVSTMQGTLGYTATPTASSFAGWDANTNLSATNLISGYATTATAGGTTTLTVSSAQSQYFTGTLSQTIKMPVTSTLTLGQYWSFVNLSSGTLTIQSSGSNTITTLGANQSTYVTCILTSGTTAASWSAETPIAGSGVVNSGTINNLAYYAANGSTVSSLATANNGVLVTDNSGVPSISSTLPTNIGLITPKITTGFKDVNGNNMVGYTPGVGTIVNYFQFANTVTGIGPLLAATGSDTNIILRLIGKGTGNAAIGGTTTNDNAAAGFVGEFITASVAFASRQNLVSTTPKDLTSITITAGDWDVWGNIFFNNTSFTNIIAWINTTSATQPDSSLISSVAATSSGGGMSIVPQRFSVNTSTTVFLTANSAFAAGTGQASGAIFARRVR